MSAGKITNLFQFGAPGSTLAPTLIPTTVYRSQLAVVDGENGSKIVKNMRIFKAGTFTDMFGNTKTWDETHLQEMGMYFHLLKDGGYFPDVPVRTDHSFSVKNVIGYLADVYRTPEDPTFLSADLQFTEPDGFDKWNRGTYRSRSLEVGMYETNDGKSYFPVVMGLAFVDIPAVEGLHARSNNLYSSQTLQDEETDPQMTTPPPAGPAGLPVTPPATQPPAQPPVAPPPAPEPQAPAQYAQQQVQHVFAVNGAPTSNFAAVQQHITLLEAFRSESIKVGRTTFIEQLARDGKIAAPMIESFAKMAETFTDEQFDAFKAGYEVAPTASTFGQYTGTPVTGSPTGGPVAGPSELDIASGVVQQFSRAGMAQDAIKNTPSYKKLLAAGKAPF